MSGTKEPAAPDLAAPAVSTGDDLPEIAQALVYDRESKNYKKIGYRFIAKASAVSGDDLNYLLCGVGGTEAVYTSANGVFNDVYPVDGGKYDLVVVNKRTGALVRKTVGGFNKLRRLSASELQTMLNMSSSQLERLFFFYFDHDKLRIECASIPEGVTEVISVDMGCVGDGLACEETQVSICAKDSGGPYSYDVVKKLIAAAQKEGADYAVDIYPYYGSDVEATLRAGYDIRHGLIGAGVYASHGYERSHRDGVLNTLRVLRGYLF